MSVVKVEKNNYTVEPLYQWDLNQVLEIYGLSLAAIPEIHFTNVAMGAAIVRQAKMDSAGVVTVDVPNSLLQKPYKITAYVCGYHGATFETYYKIDIPVNARVMPSDYTLADDAEVYSFKALENAVANANRDMLAVTQATTQALEEARAELEHTVDTIDDLVDTTVTEKTAAALAALGVEVDAKAHLEVRSYTGTGTFGSNNPCVLTFSETPSCVFITPHLDAYSDNVLSNSGLLLPNFGAVFSFAAGRIEPLVSTLEDNTATWYSASKSPADYLQLNYSGQVYDVVAVIG